MDVAARHDAADGVDRRPRPEPPPDDHADLDGEPIPAPSRPASPPSSTSTRSPTRTPGSRSAGALGHDDGHRRPLRPARGRDRQRRERDGVRAGRGPPRGQLAARERARRPRREPARDGHAPRERERRRLGRAAGRLRGQPRRRGLVDDRIATDAAPYELPFDTASLPDGLYFFRTTATDFAGNYAEGASVGPRRIDNTLPTASLADPGDNLRGTVTLARHRRPAGAAVASGISAWRTRRWSAAPGPGLGDWPTTEVAGRSLRPARQRRPTSRATRSRTSSARGASTTRSRRRRTTRRAAGSRARSP